MVWSSEELCGNRAHFLPISTSVNDTIRSHISAERDIAGGRRRALELNAGGGPREGAERRDGVPAILLLPDGTSRAPAALLLHGYNSRKERMAETIGRSLLKHGVASLAIDLPLHGARATGGEINLRNALSVAQIWRTSTNDARMALRFLADQPSIDAGRIAIVGYSLGSYLAVHVGSDPLVAVVMLAAGGDLPEDMPFVSIVRTVVNPLRDVQRLKERPLLMVNGMYDRTIRPAQARRLFEAAREPKQIVWYAAGHWPPQSEIEMAADWLASVLHEKERGTRHERSA